MWWLLHKGEIDSDTSYSSIIVVLVTSHHGFPHLLLLLLCIMVQIVGVHGWWGDQDNMVLGVNILSAWNLQHVALC